MRAFLLGAALAVGAHAQPLTSASTPTSTPASTPASAPAPAARPAPVSRANVLEPTGPAPLAPGGETVVDPASSFEIELSTRAADVRIVLLDGSDAHVAATTTREVGATTRLAITPAAPLLPGSRYVVRVEGVSTRELHDAGGAYAPASFQLLVAGTPPPPEPKKKPKSKSKSKKRARR